MRKMRKKNIMMKISFNPPFNPVSVFVSFHSHLYNHKTTVLYATPMQKFMADAAAADDDDDDSDDDNHPHHRRLYAIIKSISRIILNKILIITPSAFSVLSQNMIFVFIWGTNTTADDGVARHPPVSAFHWLLSSGTQQRV